MRVLVDADSMPVRVREIVAEQALRRGFRAVFFANRDIPLPRSGRAEHRVVADADDAIVDDAGEGDLVITHDIPLAARLVDNGLTVLDERGERLTGENIRARLGARNFAHGLREAGMTADRRRPYSAREVTLFANAFDRELTARGLVG